MEKSRINKLHFFLLWMWSVRCSAGALKCEVPKLKVKHHSFVEQASKNQTQPYMRYGPASQKPGEILYWLTRCWFRFKIKTSWSLKSWILPSCSLQGPSSLGHWRSNACSVSRDLLLSRTFHLVLSDSPKDTSILFPCAFTRGCRCGCRADPGVPKHPLTALHPLWLQPVRLHYQATSLWARDGACGSCEGS